MMYAYTGMSWGMCVTWAICRELHDIERLLGMRATASRGAPRGDGATWSLDVVPMVRGGVVQSGWSPLV